MQYIPFLSVTTTKLVADLGPPTLSQKYLDDASVVVVVRDQHFVDIARLYAAFEPMSQHRPHTWLCCINHIRNKKDKVEH